MYRVLDLFCGAGGASTGFHRAGFQVVGVDIAPQPNYPYEFHRRDALEVLECIAGGFGFVGFHAIHASPPCYAHTPLRSLAVVKANNHPDLIPATRAGLKRTGLPYVIENVRRDVLIDPLMLCGSMFGLGANGRQLRRHRYFECSFSTLQPSCQHYGQPVGVYGTGGGGQMTRGYKGTPEEYREAMGIDWATRAEIAQAIPPAYGECVGSFLRAALGKT